MPTKQTTKKTTTRKAATKKTTKVETSGTTKTVKKGRKTEVKKPVTEIIIPAMRLETMELELRGLTPLIVHKFSDKSRKQIEDNQQGKAKNKKAPKVPEEEFRGALYVIEAPKGKPGKRGYKPGRYGFPSSGFKKAAISACRYVEGVKMTAAKGSFHVLGELTEIIADEPIMRTDTVRIGNFGNKVADIRYRPEFTEWSVKLKIRYNSDAITAERIAHLYNIAGFSVGVGEWRPEKDGSFGQFEVASH